MKKKLIGMAFALAFLMGSSMAVCAQEAQEQPQPQVQTYQQMMTPEILASFDTISFDMEDEEAYAVVRNALVRRTDVWGELQDADGDGIDDRDPINGCGYLDLNYNGFDDRFEMSLIYKAGLEDPEDAQIGQIMFNMLTHRCKHGVIASTFEFDEDFGYWSIPDYFDKCEECKKEFESLEDAMEDLILPYLQ